MQLDHIKIMFIIIYLYCSKENWAKCNVNESNGTILTVLR